MGRIGRPPLGVEVRREVMRLAGEGLGVREIVGRVKISDSTVRAMLRPVGGVIRKDMLVSTGRRVVLDERVEIRIGLERGWSYRRIGVEVGRRASTIWREVTANGSQDGYRPMEAHQRAYRLARRPKPTKLGADAQLCAQVISGADPF
jgi:Helix-turn-helix domain